MDVHLASRVNEIQVFIQLSVPIYEQCSAITSTKNKLCPFVFYQTLLTCCSFIRDSFNFVFQKKK